MSLLLTLFFLALSIGIAILAGFIANHLIGRTINRQYVSFGMGMFFVGITFHSLLALPVIVSEHGFGTLLGLPNASELPFSLWELSYFALVAGIGQEIAKALPIWFERKRTDMKEPAPPYSWLGLDIGLGFSLSEILIIGISSWQPNMAGLSLANVFMGSLERLSGTLFHMATGVLIVYGMEKGKTKYLLPLCIFLHAIADFSAGYLEEYPVLSLQAEELVLFLFSITLLGSSMSYVRRHTQRPISERQLS